MTKKEVSPEDILVGGRIRELRQDILKLDSQQAFAEKLGGVTRGAVGNWELGKGIKRENLRRMADKFNVSFEWLAMGRGTPHASDQPMDAVARMIMEDAPELGEYEAELLREDVKKLINDRKKLVARLRHAR